MMELVFYTNYLNLHQVHLMDEFYALLGEGFRFVATLPRNNGVLKGGSDYSTRPYCILAGEDAGAREYAFRLAREAGTCVFGASSQAFAVERAKNNPSGLSFEMGERWLKHGWLTFGSPVFRQWLWNYFRFYRRANFYKLCCSFYTTGDDSRLKAYKGRHYKWGYFTSVTNDFVEASPEDVSTKGKVRILWCARFLLLKHPELVIRLASRLKKGGYDFVIEMYGDEGHLAPHDKVYSRSGLEALIERSDVGDVVTLKGNRPNLEIRKAMQEADFFLFTSDRNEGWGAVLNEAMSSRCAVVASDAIGSAPFLIKNGQNGFLFKSKDLNSLYEKVAYLLNNPESRQRIAEQGYLEMLRVWSPKVAAENLLKLISDLQNGRDTSILEGPCSKAE